MSKTLKVSINQTGTFELPICDRCGEIADETYQGRALIMLQMDGKKIKISKTLPNITHLCGYCVTDFRAFMERWTPEEEKTHDYHIAIIDYLEQILKIVKGEKHECTT